MHVLYIGQLPTEMGLLKRLNYLDLSRNSLSGTLPTELGRSIGLSILILGINGIRGTLPTELGMLSNMIILNLYSNSISGTLPQELGKLTAMLRYDIDGNHIKGKLMCNYHACFTYCTIGPLPTTLGAMTALTFLSLSLNRFTGTIPTELGLLQNLDQLLLFSNALTGPLPSQLGHLTVLTYMDLSQNKLGSSICSEIGFLKELNYFDVTSNVFTGLVPDSICDIRGLSFLGLCVVSKIGCPFLTGVPSCLLPTHTITKTGSLPFYNPIIPNSTLSLAPAVSLSSESSSILTQDVIIALCILVSLLLCLTYCLLKKRLPCIRRDLHESDGEASIAPISIGSDWLRSDNSSLTTYFTIRDAFMPPFYSAHEDQDEVVDFLVLCSIEHRT